MSDEIKYTLKITGNRREVTAAAKANDMATVLWCIREDAIRLRKDRNIADMIEMVAMRLDEYGIDLDDLLE